MKQVKKDLHEMCEELKKSFDSLPDDVFNSVPSKDNAKYIRVNMSGRRWTTAWKLFKCSVGMLIKGKTTLLVKKR